MWRLLLLVAVTQVFFITGCRDGSPSGHGGLAPIARSAPESWKIDGKQYAISSTYYLALPEGFQFTAEYEVPPGTNPGTLTDAEAYELAFPMMRHIAETRLYDRIHVSKLGSGGATVSRIGVVLFARTPAGTQGYRVARPLTEIESRLGREPRSPAPDVALDAATAFSMKDAGPRQLLFLFAMVVAVGITVAGIVKWVRNRRSLARKWLWLVAILAGVGKLGLNWTTGEMIFAPVGFQLFSAGAFKPAGSTSWVMFLSLPLGALIFLFRGHAGSDRIVGTTLDT